MTIAQLARDSARHFEAKKDGLQQRQSGDWVLRLTVQATDMPMEIMQAQMGQRYVVALVAIGDNEEPTSSPSAGRPAGDGAKTGRPAPVEESRATKRAWNEILPQKQAAIIGSEPAFRMFAKEQHEADFTDETGAADFIRHFCGVDSRKQLETDHRARVLWNGLANQYRIWRDHPEMVA